VEDGITFSDTLVGDNQNKGYFIALVLLLPVFIETGFIRQLAIKKAPETRSLSFGWKMGFEPTTPGTTIQCSNQLSYIHHLFSAAKIKNLFHQKKIF
jgi:hypothetical protein